MHEILKKKYSKKIFFQITILTILYLILIRYFILPALDNNLKTTPLPFLSNLADGMIASIIIAVFIGSFVFFLTPEIVRKSSIDIVEPRELPELFDTAFPKTETWWYKGSCGRYFRTKTLPTMAHWARKQSLSREVKAVILDPLNKNLCENYAIYRNSTASADRENREWDLNKVRNELYATIITLLVIQRSEPILRISLALVSHYSTFRIDLSDDYAIITKEDRKAPAIICNRDSYYYKSYKDEILLSESQSRHIPPLTHGNYKLDRLSSDNVKQILQDAKINNDEIRCDEFDIIAKLCRERVNPYA